MTRELGPRAPAELDRQRDREIGRERLTGLDRELERLSSGGGTIDMADLATVSSLRQRARLLSRLQVLERLALVHRHAPGSWALEGGWSPALRALGERGDIIKRINAALRAPGDGARYRMIDGTSELPPVEGVLRRRGLHDELRGDMYAIVEDPSGRVHYVRTDAASLAGIEDWAIVRVSAARDTWAKGMDAAIAKFALAAGGTYDPAAHLSMLQREPVVIRGDRLDPAAVIAANVRRLDRLARYGLVTPLAAGRWRVPPDLVAELKAREKSHSRVRVRLDRMAPPLSEQLVVRGGPAWVDSAVAGAPYGFGAEVQAARSKRVARGPNTERATSDPAVLVQLSKESRSVGERLARDRGLRLVADPPSGYRGVLVELGGSDAGRYIAVVDERARSFALLPREAAPQGAKGTLVEILREADGRVVVWRSDLTKGA